MDRPALGLLLFALVGCHGRAESPVGAAGAPVTPRDPAPEAPHAAGAGLDPFGVRMLYPSIRAGLVWVSRWGAPARRLTGRDPHDPWFDADHGDASYDVPGDG